MKSLSYWSYNHKTSARILILVAYLILNVAGLFLGDLLHSITGTFNQGLILIPVILTLVGYIFYPDKKNKAAYKNFYMRHKMMDAVLISSTFFFIVISANMQNSFYSREGAFAASFVITPEHNEINKTSIVAKDHLSNKEVKKSWKKKLREIRKTYKQTSKGNKTILIILVILGAAIVSYGVVGLSCSIACSGSEALGYIVGFIGVGAVIFGAIKLIQRITRGPKSPGG